MEKSCGKRVLIVAAVCLALLGGIVLLSFFYRCPFYAFFGIPCPGCGMTRAFLSLLRFDFVGAWGWNPMVFPLLFCAGYAVICCLLGRFAQAKSMRLWGTVAVLMLIVWLLRLLGGGNALPIAEDSLGEWLFSIWKAGI